MLSVYRRGTSVLWPALRTAQWGAVFSGREQTRSVTTFKDEYLAKPRPKRTWSESADDVDRMMDELDRLDKTNNKHKKVLKAAKAATQQTGAAQPVNVREERLWTAKTGQLIKSRFTHQTQEVSKGHFGQPQKGSS